MRGIYNSGKSNTVTQEECLYSNTNATKQLSVMLTTTTKQYKKSCKFNIKNEKLILIYIALDNRVKTAIYVPVLYTTYLGTTFF